MAPLAGLAFGTAATGAAAVPVAGTAATGGLFGTGGTFALGPTLMTLGTGLGVYGQIQAGQAAAAQAQSQAAIANYNAQLMRRQFEQERLNIEAQKRADELRRRQEELRRSYEQRRQAEAGAREMGALEAALGAAGAVTTAGIPLLIQARQASELEQENLMIGYVPATYEYYPEPVDISSRDILQAKMYGQQARYARTGGYLMAGQTLLTGFGRRFV